MKIDVSRGFTAGPTKCPTLRSPLECGFILRPGTAQATISGWFARLSVHGPGFWCSAPTAKFFSVEGLCQSCKTLLVRSGSALVLPVKSLNRFALNKQALESKKHKIILIAESGHGNNLF